MENNELLREESILDEIGSLIKTLVDKIAIAVDIRGILNKNGIDLDKETQGVIQNLFLIEDGLRESSLMLDRCIKHIRCNNNSNDTVDDEEIIKNKKSNTNDKANAISLDTSSNANTNTNNSRQHHFNKTNTHATTTATDIGHSMYRNQIKPKLNFTYNSESELNAIMHIDYSKPKTTTQHNDDCDDSIIDLNEPIKEKPPIKYPNTNKEKPITTPVIQPNKPIIEYPPFDTFNKKDSEVLLIEDNDNKDSIAIEDYNKDNEDDTLTKLIIQNNRNEAINEDINPIDTASKIKTKATKVAQLVTLINSNSDLFELLSQLFETDDIIDLLLREEVDETLIDSIYASIEEIERLKMEDEYNESYNNSNSQMSSNRNRSGFNFITRTEPIMEDEENEDRLNNEDKPNDVHVKANINTNDNTNANNQPHSNNKTSIIKPNKTHTKKVNVSLNKKKSYSNDKEKRKRTKINLISNNNIKKALTNQT